MYPKMQDWVQISTTRTRNGAWAQGREGEWLVSAVVRDTGPRGPRGLSAGWGREGEVPGEGRDGAWMQGHRR